MPKLTSPSSTTSNPDTGPTPSALPEDTATPRWWRTLEEHAEPALARARRADEFGEPLPVGEGADVGAADGSNRRDFFKVMGLSATAAMAACQRAPEQKILPFTYKPDEVTPGLSLWYASLCGGCAAGCGLLVKTRDGRPIKIEGNPSHPVSGGAVCAVGQASLLGLYDADRARGPRLAGARVGWPELDAAVAAGLAGARRGERLTRVVVPWGMGPTEEQALDQLLAAAPGARVVRFDPMGKLDALAAAHEAIYGARLVPEYRLDRADVVVAFDADFLGTFQAPAPLARQWSAARATTRTPMLRHIQLEGHLSLTGGAADRRIALLPSMQAAGLVALVRALLASAGDGPGSARLAAMAAPIVAAIAAAEPPLAPALAREVETVARELRGAGSRGVVLCGSERPDVQLLAALANAALGNASTTAVLDAAEPARPGELSLDDLVAEMSADRVGAVIFVGTNPALVDARLARALPRVPFSLSTGERLDETAALVTAHAPQGHYLENWTDHRPRAGVEALGQPCVAPLFDTRSATTSLLTWSSGGGAGAKDAHAALQARWRRDVLSDGVAGGAGATFEARWDAALREGVLTLDAKSTPPPLATEPAAALALVRASAAPRPSAGSADAPAFELLLHASVALHDGAGATANNGWLQELPDPISKVSWGNFAALAPARAAALGVSDGDIVEVRSATATVRLPVLSQPGLPPSLVAVAVGHGRAHAGRIAAGHGVDVWPLADVVGGRLRRAGVPVTVTRIAGESRPLAMTQTHASQEGRELVRQVRRDELARNPRAGNEAAPAGQGRKHLGLWPGHAYEGHRWGLAIDLNKCTGCAACVVSCSVENNIPIVGETEVRRRREMHWLRIDRYYGGSPEAPEVLHQPMMCQHCENAPCETVCPVVATVHSSEGLNQQIYNRCVGTRYCANNCPTKVRRFNWFDYDRGGDLARMVLNPDVVVRSRGVMEKCSMCVQRIEEARALGRREGRLLADGDIATACQQSCPAQAITFGDANDPGSALSASRHDPRTYTILEELNVKPQVTYQVRIKNEHGEGEGGAGEGAGVGVGGRGEHHG